MLVREGNQLFGVVDAFAGDTSGVIMVKRQRGLLLDRALIREPVYDDRGAASSSTDVVSSATDGLLRRDRCGEACGGRYSASLCSFL
ncbi:MAG: hypothetical protein IPG54_09340 [Sphingomonadales bacterium]|nr:hypothetical protein [Sphingomonadales bacterium]